MPALLFLSPVSNHTPRTELLRLLDSVAGIPERQVERIELRGRGAVIALPDDWAAKAVERLDGQTFADRRRRRRRGGPGGTGQLPVDKPMVGQAGASATTHLLS